MNALLVNIIVEGMPLARIPLVHLHVNVILDLPAMECLVKVIFKKCVLMGAENMQNHCQFLGVHI